MASFVYRAIGETPELQIIAEACDGEEAVQKAKDLKPDLVVLDIGLPKLNGIEVARQIRKLCPECRIVFLTENESKDVIEECFRAGASGYVVKSSAATDLISAIHCCNRRQSLLKLASLRLARILRLG